MANLGKKNGVFVARFRFLGKEHKKSLKTVDLASAHAAMHRIEDALHRLAINLISVPDGVDPADFIVSGGTLLGPKCRMTRITPTLGAVIDEFVDNLGHLAESTRYTIGVHLRNLKKKLTGKVDFSIDRIEQRDLELFLQARLKERSPTTVSKERVTIEQMFRWSVDHGYLSDSPASKLTMIKAGGELSPFRTVAEIEAMLTRGGLGQEEAWALWDCLYLTTVEIAEVLNTVRQRCKQDVSFLLHAIPAYTAMRRGELLRLRWNDVEFDQESLIARSKKQSRQVTEVQRRIDLHPELKTILLDWRKQRPRGQYIICDEGSTAALTHYEANKRLWQPLRGTKWCLSSRKNRFKIGFHTYRHSFASNLAALGIDQRIIDGFLGHSTEAMRRRYRHLFPKDRRSAMESFSLAATEQSRS